MSFAASNSVSNSIVPVVELKEFARVIYLVLIIISNNVVAIVIVSLAEFLQLSCEPDHFLHSLCHLLHRSLNHAQFSCLCQKGAPDR